MKTKSVMQTVGPMTKEHAYLGHFKSEKVLNQGHNDSGRATKGVHAGHGSTAPYWDQEHRDAVNRAGARSKELHGELIDDRFKDPVRNPWAGETQKREAREAQNAVRNLKEQEMEALDRESAESYGKKR